MKKLLIALTLLIGTSVAGFSQKYAFVDTDYILDKLPEYKEAQKQLDELSIFWQNRIETKYAEIEQMYRSFQAEKILLTEEMKRKREDEIIAKEKEVKDFQREHFGAEGKLFQKRQELIKPIQDKIYEAIKEVAQAGNYSVIFDKSGQSTILFADPKYDKSDAVLKKLGYKPPNN